MSEEFDPYRKWLGIPPDEQPPHHYRLLGIAAFEDDPDVIDNAADRQMAHVRTYQTGKNARHSQNILNELAAAKLCLLDAERKAVYDRQLREQLERMQDEQATAEPPAEFVPPPPPPVPPAPTATPVPPTPAAQSPAYAVPVVSANPFDPAVAVAESPEPESAAPAGVHIRTRRRRRRSQLPLVITVLAIIALFAAIVVGFRGFNKPPDDDGNSPSGGDKIGAESNPARGANGLDSTKKPPKSSVSSTGNGSNTGSSSTAQSGIKEPSTPGGDPDSQPAREEQFLAAITAARAAMHRRDLNVAKQHLQTADVLKRNQGESDETEKNRALIGYLDGFQNALTNGVNKFRNDGGFDFDGDAYQFVQRTGETLAFKVNGQEVRATREKLSSQHAFAIAAQGTNKDNPHDYVCLAAFLAMDGEKDRTQQREKAKELWAEAAKRGFKDQYLAAELGVNDSVAKGIDTPSPFNPPPTGNGSAREAVPTSDALLVANATLRKIYTKEFERLRKDRGFRKEFADTLYRDALSERDSALKYALFEQARKLAIDEGNPDQLGLVIDAVAATFNVDALREKQISLVECARSSEAKPAQIYTTADRLFLQASDEHEYVVARALADVALNAARKANNVEAIKSVTVVLRKLDKLVVIQTKAEEAQVRLNEDPEDPQANLQLGLFRCFYKGDWQGGLPYLAKGTSSDEADFAKAELANPQDAQEQLALADGWYVLSKTHDDPAGKTLADRAKHWYEQAVNKLEGDERASVEQRLRELNSFN